MKELYKRPAFIKDEPFTYCPGCSHGIVHRLLCEVIDELGIRESTIGICSIGCSVRIWNFLDLDFIQATHGRAMAFATGAKRANPDKCVFTYQGDGDAMSIGAAETIHAIARGEKITTLFVNNAYYGATGGQLAPTTLPGQKTTTYPEGRTKEQIGNPIRTCELLSTLDSDGYIARVAVDTPTHIRQAKAALKKAFEVQLSGEGFGYVEFLCACPSNLKLANPVEAWKWIGANSQQYFPLGEFKLTERMKEARK